MSDIDDAVEVAKALAYYAWNVDVGRRVTDLIEKCWPGQLVDHAKWEHRLGADMIPFSTMDVNTRREYVQLALDWAKDHM